MNIVGWLIAAYLVAILILLHATLLFCSDSHCVYVFDKPPVSIEVGFQIRRAIANLLPYEMKLMQTWAQWIVVGEIMLVFLYVLKIASKILWYLIWLMMAFLITIIIIAFLSNANLIGQAQTYLLEQGYLNPAQIGNIA